jgi:hypothetical protein
MVPELVLPRMMSKACCTSCGRDASGTRSTPFLLPSSLWPRQFGRSRRSLTDGTFLRNEASPATTMGTLRPRPVILGRTYMFTRRRSERRFFLRPDPVVTNSFWYCLGWAADKHGMLLHGAGALSNHVHVVASDPRGVYPDFLRDFHGLLARVVNAARGRWEHFWDANQASVVLLEDEAAQLDKVVYALTNPVGLVEKAADWPGATSLDPVLTGATIVAKRPEHFFRAEDAGGGLPATIELFFSPPPALSDVPIRDRAAGSPPPHDSISTTHERAPSTPRQIRPRFAFCFMPSMPIVGSRARRSQSDRATDSPRRCARVRRD